MATTTDKTQSQGRTMPLAEQFDTQITREWLITNGRGGYASGTVLGIPTRRYHGLLIAAARPPLERWTLLSNVLERLTIDGQTCELASFEFDGVIHPEGYRLQTGFEAVNDPLSHYVQFNYEAFGAQITKRVQISRDTDEVIIQYHVQAPARAAVTFDVLPFVPMRDFHGTTHTFEGGFPVHQIGEQAVVEAYSGGPRVWLLLEPHQGVQGVAFEHQPDFWHGFVYREELHRGFGDKEDLFVPGCFRAAGRGPLDVVFRATADFTGGRLPQASPASTLNPQPRTPSPLSIEARLRNAADAFVVKRRRANGSDSTTILAGYHWFGDWGRDAFIALPGLLLETRRFAEAREVLATFASAQQDGLIPNRFSDYGDGCDYNSVDASLWYLHAAVAYCRASGDQHAWKSFLAKTCGQIVDSFLRGTHFNIHVDADGLVACGDASTQITWMDAKCGDTVFTPRHGKPVEINALWYHGLLALAAQVQSEDPRLAKRYRSLAKRAGDAFCGAFWNAASHCLYDVVRDGQGDPAIRPNQIFAVSLPNSPLNDDQRRDVLACVQSELFTPYGLRSLSPRDSRYRPRYEGSPYERDSAYHQGTVWGWLIGPYIEAYLRVHNQSSTAKAQARRMLQPLIDHLDQAGIGSVSEIFDGDPPHTPRGCIAQAWSVGELLRAWHMTESKP